MNEPPACRHLASALLPWYLNGALGPDQHAMVRDHVESCDLCAAELSDLEEVKRRASPSVFAREFPHQAVSTEPPSSHGRTGWLIAVVLAVPAILGLVWVFLGVVKGR